jgi:cytochrome oxidase assembly protein ShyY1
VYRFLLTPRWLAAFALTVVAAVIMVMLGNWQLRRYHERTDINERIDSANAAPAVPLTTVLGAPTVAGTPGAAPGKALAWTKVTMTGRYDTAHEIQARGRTVEGEVGFEIVTPLLLDDGTAVLVDRGWVPAPAGGAIASPEVPPAPSGLVTVVGQIHLSESRPAPIERRDGRLDTRRLNVPRLATEMPFPVYGAYVLVTEQTPAADPAFVPVPIPHEDAWQNGGYAVQWWIFAVMAFLLFGWQARREAHGVDGPPARKPRDRVADTDRRRAERTGDRVEEADRRRAERTGDRVEEADRRQAAAAAATAPGKAAGDAAEGRLAAPGGAD